MVMAVRLWRITYCLGNTLECFGISLRAPLANNLIRYNLIQVSETSFCKMAVGIQSPSIFDDFPQIAFIYVLYFRKLLLNQVTILPLHGQYFSCLSPCALLYFTFLSTSSLDTPTPAILLISILFPFPNEIYLFPLVSFFIPTLQVSMDYSLIIIEFTTNINMQANAYQFCVSGCEITHSE